MDKEVAFSSVMIGVKEICDVSKSLPEYIVSNGKRNHNLRNLRSHKQDTCNFISFHEGVLISP